MQLVTSPPPRQGWLDLGGPVEHFRLIHGGHSSNVALCSRAGRGKWEQQLHSRDAAAAIVPLLVANGDCDVYQSQHGFSGQRRVAKDVTALTSSFVDLDHYKVPELSGLNPDALLDRVRAVHQWLPVPTLIFNSGRGAYFQWLYPRPIGRDYLSKWQALEDILVELLAPFGADPQAKDPSRVLRVVGSTNQKTGAIVTGSRDTGPAISFDRLYSIVTKHCITDRKKAQEQVAEPTLVLASSTDAAVVLAQQPSAQRTRQEATAKQKANYLDPYKLAFYRIEDCRTLATLRGLMTDCRHRMLFVYAAAAAWYVSDEEQLRAELEAFAADHFQDAARYSADRVGSIIDRLRHDQQGGIARIWHGHRVPSRYKLSNRYIIGSLEISGAEQHHMKTIIGEEERQRRRLARRRAQGIVERPIYLANAAEKRTRAVELRDAMDMTHSEIAEEMGIPRGSVPALLRPRTATAFDAKPNTD